MRVIALTPAAAEIMHGIGAADLLVGRSHDADWPPDVASLPAVTRSPLVATAAADIDAEVRATVERGLPLTHLDRHAFEALAPTLVLTQRSCRVCSAAIDTVAEHAAHCGAEVLTLDPSSVEDVLDDIVRVGDACGRPEAATDAMVHLRARYWDARNYVNPYLDGPRTAVIEWASPLYLAGHWTPGMIEAAGGAPIGPAAGAPSSPIDPDLLVQARPDRVIIAPCGTTPEEATAQARTLRSQPWWQTLPAARTHDVHILDGRRSFSRPGPGLIDVFEWLVQWLSPRAKAGR